MDWEWILAGCMVFLYGIVIGSFLNVCIYRIPKGEDIVKVNSHCMSCGYHLKWYDLIPIISYLMLGGRCRKCKTRISCQYPLIEALNGILYVLIFIVKGFTIDMVLCCLLASVLIVITLIDWRTFEIPFGLNVVIFFLGLIRLWTHRDDWLTYLIGFFAVSGFLYILFLVSKGQAIGGGDIKLMAAAGLFLGWQQIIVAFLMGCILGSVIHVIRMKVSDAEHVLAMGPYLSAGILIAALWGEPLIQWYMTMWQI